MTAEHESAHSPEQEQGRTRRDVLTATGGALAFVAVPPVAGAIPASAADGDAGLARIKMLYAEWVSLRREWQRLGDVEDAMFDRWREAHPRTPEPEPPAEIAWLWTKATHGTIEAARDPATPISIPPHLLDMLDRREEAFGEWLRSQPDDDDPELKAIGRANEELWNETYAVRQAILDTKTRSHRALLIKMVVGFDADTLDELPAKIEEAGDFDAEFAAGILPDLEALAGERLAA